MSRRISPEQRVLDFFRSEPLVVAEAILRLAVAEVKARRPVAASKPPRKHRSKGTGAMSPVGQPAPVKPPGKKQSTGTNEAVRNILAAPYGGE